MSWEYEALFDVEEMMNGQTTLMDWISEGERRHRTNMRVGIFGYQTKTTVAGPRLEAEVYPMYGRDTSATLRRAKKTNVTPERQARLNRERAIRHLVQLADANFTE